jgi:hypothetical protein
VTNAARTAIAVLLLAAIGAAVFMIPRGDAPRSAGTVPAVVEHEDGGLVLTFHVMTGTFGLFDAKADRAKLTNLAKSRPADVERLRAALTKKLGLKDLEELRHASREQLEWLHKLGYF